MRARLIFGTLAWVVIMATGTAVADEAPDPVYRVDMEATYDPEEARIEGVERLRWRNTSSVPVDELQFHLYLNAFANDRTTFMTESGGEHRGFHHEGRRWGYVEVDAMRAWSPRPGPGTALPSDASWTDWPPDAPWGDAPPGFDLSEAQDLKAVEEFIRPDDDNPDDFTVARYALTEPIPPGGWIDVEIRFTSQLPQIVARTGAHGDYVLAGQWFPKIGVFEDVGDRGRETAGWNVHQFHANSEFYADFGDWDVTLTLPARYQGKVGATGQLVEERVDGDTLTVRFVQDGIHDFAWTGDPRYDVIRDRFDPVADVPPEQLERIAATLGVPAAELALEPVEITLLLQPANRAMRQRYLDSAKAAIRGYGLRLGAYPYPTLTLVDPARGALGSGGMEYQTFITLFAHPALGLPPLQRVLMPELVTIHEFGHNFFQGMIANNEFEEAWIDEGINSYYEMVVMEDEYGVSIELGGLRITPFEQNHAAIAGGGFTDAIAQPSWTYRSGGSYGLNSYPRPAVTLRHLELLMGPEAFHRTMREFFQRWRFRHPSTADFEAVFLEASNGDLEPFLRQALHTDEHLDYAVRSATSRRDRGPVGWFREDGELVLTGHAAHRGEDDPTASSDDEDTEPVTDDGDHDTAGDDEGEDDELYRTEVVVERRGGFIHPVVVELEFDDGHVVRHDWDGRGRWVRFTDTRPAKLVRAEVDPDRVLALDVDRLNNGRLLEGDATARRKIVTQILYWLQNLVEATTIVG
jgi:hypothetical protein